MAASNGPAIVSERRQIGLFRGLLQRLEFKRPVRESSLLIAPF